jgi:hypothetical protein
MPSATILMTDNEGQPATSILLYTSTFVPKQDTTASSYGAPYPLGRAVRGPGKKKKPDPEWFEIQVQYELRKLDREQRIEEIRHHRRRQRQVVQLIAAAEL